MDNLKNTYSIILPTFNEAGHIKKLILEIYEIFLSSNDLFEIIIVDDNSTDGTSEIINEISKTNKVIISVIRKNKKGSLVDSLNEGIILSKYENIIWMDADYSHPPEYLKEIIDYNKKKDADLIVFSRFLTASKRYYDVENKKPLFVDLLSKILNSTCNFLLFKDFTDYTSGYICVKKNIVKNNQLKGYYGDYFIRLIVESYFKKKKIIELPFIEKDRLTGQSKTTFNKISFLIKCFFYLKILIISMFKKNLFNFKKSFKN